MTVSALSSRTASQRALDSDHFDGLSRVLDLVLQQSTSDTRMRKCPAGHNIAAHEASVQVTGIHSLLGCTEDPQCSNPQTAGYLTTGCGDGSSGVCQDL
eukprot:6489029-Amphidinium_carterae.2